MPVLFLAPLAVSSVLGFSTDNSSVVRSYNRIATLTNEPIVVSVTFTNGEAGQLRGFCYCEQVPSELTVNPLSLTVNGSGVINYIFEAGRPGDVYAGCTPYRWVLEQPPLFFETNPVPASARVEISFSLSSTTPGTFNLQEYDWMAYSASSPGGVFGHSGLAEQQVLTFLNSPPAPVVEWGHASEGFVLTLDGTLGHTYVIEGSTNLAHWDPEVTNIAPFSLTATNMSGFSMRFYRARQLP